MKEIIKELSIAASIDDSRPHLCAVHSVDGCAYATDGHRLHYTTAAITPGSYAADGTKHHEGSAAAAPVMRSLSAIQQTFESKLNQDLALPSLDVVRGILKGAAKGLYWMAARSLSFRAQLPHFEAQGEAPAVNLSYLADALEFVGIGCTGQYNAADDYHPIVLRSIDGSRVAVVCPVRK